MRRVAACSAPQFLRKDVFLMLTIQKLPLCAKGAPVAITLEIGNHMRVTLMS